MLSGVKTFKNLTLPPLPCNWVEKSKCKMVLLVLTRIGNRYYYEQTFGYRLGIIHLFLIGLLVLLLKK